VLPSLELEQEVEALVVDELADGRLVLDIGGALVEGNDPGSLGIGQRLRLRVDLLEPQILLHIVDQELPLEAEVARLLRQRLPVADQDSLGGLQATLDLRSLVDESGSASLWTEKLKTFLRKLFNAQETMTSERPALRDETVTRRRGARPKSREYCRRGLERSAVRRSQRIGSQSSSR